MSNLSPHSAGPGWDWIPRMAWRDSRGKRLLLLLFTGSIVFGIGAIVAIQSLRVNLERIVDEQARSLLGSDIVLQTRKEPSPALEAFIRELPGRKVRELRFRSMVAFPDSGESRFVQIRAVDGPVPFYGSMETSPAGNGGRLMPSPGMAFVEEGLMLQLGLQPGDTLRLGSRDYAIEAALVRMAGESEITGFFAPRIYVPMDSIHETGLIQTGSMLRHRFSLALDPESLPAAKRAIEEVRDTLFVDEGVRVETVADRKRSIERVLDNLLDFLNLTGFVALLLGGIGIIGAVNIYLQGKRETIAVLRCLGATPRIAFAVYLFQVLIFGFGGAVGGTALGVAAQFIVPELLQSFLPFPVVMKISYGAIGSGLAFGWLTVAASAMLPLLGVRRISPLRAIRASVEPPHGALSDPLAWIAGTALLLGLLGFSIFQSGKPLFSLVFAAALVGVLLLLALTAWAVRALLRRLARRSAPYAWRIALGNLYRPGNRTLLMITTLGTGALLINLLLLTREGLLGQVDFSSSEDAANVILLDIQADQLDPLQELLREEGMPARDILPIVTMRVASIKGRSLREYRSMAESPVSDWVYSWEFRNTYRDHVLDNAEVVAGEFIPRHDGSEPFPVSISENVMDDLGVGIGDSITWDVQGVSVESVVSSIRRVRWQAGRQNFNIVFPLDTIEAAPTVYAAGVKTDSRLQTTELQRALAPEFPNVSLIDLSLIFETVSEILDQASFVIKFMAGFTIATGLLVLSGTVLGSRYQRIRESVLFRTLGAKGAFIRSVLAVEFVLLGLIAGVAGVLLSWAAAWALLRYVFDIPFAFRPLESLLVASGLAFLTWLTGRLTSRGIAAHPPLTVLRKE